MASPSVKPNRMKRMESKKSYSWWWDSHISPKNSKWLQENLEEMDHNVKRMLKLIEEDADSFAKKAELYFKKRPELISLVEEFYRIYRSLAEKYDNVTGELRKNVPSDLQSQGSGISDIGSDQKPARTKSGPRAAGFDVFLGSATSGSDRNKEGDDESLTLDSETESEDDESSVNNYNGDEHGMLRDRISELEAEIMVMKEKAQLAKEEVYEEELRVARENARKSGEEITRLMLELRRYENIDNGAVSEGLEFVESEQNQVKEVQESVDEQSIKAREEEFRVTSEKLCDLEEELVKKGMIVEGLQDQLMLAQNEIAVWKNKLDKEKTEVLKLLERVTRYKNNLSDRDQEIRGLKEAMSNVNKTLSEENEELQGKMTRMIKERKSLEENMKDLDLRCQYLEDEIRQLKAAKAERENVFGDQIELLKGDISERDYQVEELGKKLEELRMKHDVLIATKDEQISQMGEHLHQLHLQHVELIAGADLARRSSEGLRFKVEELEKEVERKQAVILEGEEGKREAIRQLSFSLEHYRAEYCELRRAMVHKHSITTAG